MRKHPTSENFTHMSTDYYRGTSLEPEVTSSLKASFEEYEALGKRHREVSSRIEDLNEAMKLSRQRGAFQQLQSQMKEVKELVKKREDLDSKMAVADLARKKDDDHRLAIKQEVSYSEQLSSVGDRIAELESMLFSYAEQTESEFDFARCQRSDGSFYGTRGKCKKGKDARVAEKAEPGPTKPGKSGRGAKSTKAPLKRGPLHAEVKNAQEKLKKFMPELRAKGLERDALLRQALAQQKVVKKQKSPENKQKLIEIYRALAEKERAFKLAEKEADRLAREWRRLNKRNERAKMSPQQRSAEAALDREMRLRG